MDGLGDKMGQGRSQLQECTGQTAALPHPGLEVGKPHLSCALGLASWGSASVQGLGCSGR